MDKKLKILFIPADNIDANISRSYYFAKGLSNFSEVYYVTWKDYRTVKWLGGKLSKLNTLKCFFSSLFASYKVFQREGDAFLRVNCSVFIDAIIGRVIGRVRGKKIMRKHNSKTLNKLINKLKPDVIFYSDASYFFPALDNTDILQVCDLQDDLEWNIFSKKAKAWETQYLKTQYQKYDIHYIVSKSAKESIANHIGDFPFKEVYNGADYTELQKDYSTQISNLKASLNIENKYVITHIGSATWVDPVFTKKLFSEIYKRDKSIVLILVGSMAKIDLPNVINTGMVPVNESYLYYNLTDLALLLKDSVGSGFLYNSVPLKNIQYAAVKKPVISFPIQWLEREKYTNTTIINDSNVDKWIEEIEKIRHNYTWSKEDTLQWENYNWKFICGKMFNEIFHKLNN